LTGGPAGLSDHCGNGSACRLTEGRQATLKAIVLQGPDPKVEGVSTWRLIDLCGIVQDRFGVTYSETGMLKLLCSRELSWQTPRLRHAETDPATQARFKKGALRKPSHRARPTTPRPSGSRSGSRTRPG